MILDAAKKLECLTLTLLKLETPIIPGAFLIQQAAAGADVKVLYIVDVNFKLGIVKIFPHVREGLENIFSLCLSQLHQCGGVLVLQAQIIRVTKRKRLNNSVNA